jgi:DNA-binding NtrC family response regulator
MPYQLRTGTHGGEVNTLPLKRAPAPMAEEDDTPRTLREVEMNHILRTLEKHNGNKVAAAAELGIVLKTLYNKLNALQEERKTAG